MKFDEILTTIGEFGPYQKRIFCLMCLAPMICAFQVFGGVFMYDLPSFRCRIPGYPGDTYTIQDEAHSQAVRLGIPPGDSRGANGSYSGCEIYSDFNATTYLGNGTRKGLIWNTNASHLGPTDQCDEWVYDLDDGEETVITEFDLVCDLAILRAHSFMAVFAGALVGSIVMGAIADIFGRKKAILLAFAFQFITGMCAYFSPSFQFLIGVRVVSGISTHALFAISATTGIELVGPKCRALTGVLVEIFWCFGVLGVIPLAYFVREWRTLQLIICLASLPLIALTFWYLPESPRWLLDKERYAEAEKILNKVCRANKSTLPKGALDSDTANEGPQIKIWNIFGNKSLMLRYSVLVVCWFSVNLLYYGVTLSIANLSGSQYFNYLITGVVEIIACCVCLPLLWIMGRRTLFIASLLFTSLCCLISVLAVLLQAPNWLLVAMNMGAKFGSSVAYAVLYILTSELFPTVLRHSGIGMCSIFENVGGIAASYISDLNILVGGTWGPALHMIVFCGVAFIGGFISFILPETANRILPETIQDAIEFDSPKRIYLPVCKEDKEMTVYSSENKTEINRTE